MKGAFKLRPSRPKYDKTWDIGAVLSVLKAWVPLEGLNLVELIKKLVNLLAIGSAHRVQTFTAIKLANVKHSPRGYELEVADILKISRPDAFQPLILLPYLKENPGLCVASTLDVYIERTAPLRGGCNTLLITTKKPHGPALVDSISLWIRATLAKCGIITLQQGYFIEPGPTPEILFN